MEYHSCIAASAILYKKLYSFFATTRTFIVMDFSGIILGNMGSGNRRMAWNVLFS